MIEVKAPEKKPPPPVAGNCVTLFTAGSIEMGKAENWQERLVNALDGEEVIIFNPRRDDWDSSWVQSIENEQFREQVEWELDHLDNCDIMVVHFTPDTMSPITLLELGLYAAVDPDKLIVFCPEGFWRKGNVDIVCKRYGVLQTATFDELVEECKKRINI
jgi:hypothetical protein